MAFNLSGLTPFTDEVSFGLISEAVLGSQIMNYAQVRPGYSAGTVAVNLLTSTLAPAAAGCGWNTGGTAAFTQVDLIIADKQVKESMCPEDLRAYWLSSQLSASGNLQDVAFPDAIAALKSAQIKAYVEQVVFQGDGGTVTGLIADIDTGSGAIIQSGLTAAAWTPSNALAQAQALVNGLPSNVLDRNDLIMYMSFSSFRALSQAMVAANYYHYNPGNQGTGAPLANQTLVIPGTNVTAVPFAGMGTSNRVFCGPKEFIIVGTGLTSDYDTMDIFFDKYNDTVKFMAKFRIGVACAFPSYFSTNDLA
jgi:hypothetical protein